MNRDKIPRDSEVAIKYCGQLAEVHLGLDLANKTPKAALSGGGGAYGYETTVVSWGDLDVNCTVKRVTDLGAPQLVKFEFGEKDLTGLIKREERN